MKILPCVIGLGYVGLPVLLKISKHFSSYAFDTNKNRIITLKKKIDTNNEFKFQDFNKLKKITYTSKYDEIKNCNFFIICVSTPLSKNKKPKLDNIIKTLSILKKLLKKNDIIFLESSVYPGFSKNIFITYLEKNTNLKNNKDFFFGYSPERVNPGDKIHTIDNIAKIVAYETDNKLIKNRIEKIYKTISKNIVYSNKINETEISKIIENIQRDINIAFINEILVLCKKMKLEFKEVIKLANTKWNFLNFKPGLVGGHCLPINSHYLSWSAGTMMNKSSLILSARKTNDSMKDFIINEVKYSLKIKNLSIKKSKLLFVGISYKSGVSDLRNSLNLEIFNYFKKNNKNIVALDPFLSSELSKQNNILKKIKDFTKFNVIIFLSYHTDFRKIYYNLKKLKNNKTVILDPFNFY